MRITCKSTAQFWEKERDGRKNNTVRQLDGNDWITIVNTETKKEFERQITDISVYEGRIIISWK